MAKEERGRILLVDNNALYRKALRCCLETAGYTVVGELSDGSEVLDKLASLHPNLVIMDAFLPDASGTSICSQITREFPEVKILLLSSYDQDAKLLQERALLAGAVGCLSKSLIEEQYLDAVVLSLQDGVSLFSPQLLQRALRAARCGGGEDGLTSRETEVLSLLEKSMTNKEIAEVLVICPRTVGTHVSNILGKLGVHGRREAVSMMRRSRSIMDVARSPKWVPTLPRSLSTTWEGSDSASIEEMKPVVENN